MQNPYYLKHQRQAAPPLIPLTWLSYDGSDPQQSQYSSMTNIFERLKQSCQELSSGKGDIIREYVRNLEYIINWYRSRTPSDVLLLASIVCKVLLLQKDILAIKRSMLSSPSSSHLLHQLLEIFLDRMRIELEHPENLVAAAKGFDRSCSLKIKEEIRLFFNRCHTLPPPKDCCEPHVYSLVLQHLCLFRATLCIAFSGGVSQPIADLVPDEYVHKLLPLLTGKGLYFASEVRKFCEVVNKLLRYQEALFPGVARVLHPDGLLVRNFRRATMEINEAVNELSLEVHCEIDALLSLSFHDLTIYSSLYFKSIAHTYYKFCGDLDKANIILKTFNFRDHGGLIFVEIFGLVYESMSIGSSFKSSLAELLALQDIVPPQTFANAVLTQVPLRKDILGKIPPDSFSQLVPLREYVLGKEPPPHSFSQLVAARANYPVDLICEYLKTRSSINPDDVTELADLIKKFVSAVSDQSPCDRLISFLVAVVNGIQNIAFRWRHFDADRSRTAAFMSFLSLTLTMDLPGSFQGIRSAASESELPEIVARLVTKVGWDKLVSKNVRKML
jgi:hypothetical protein